MISLSHHHQVLTITESRQEREMSDDTLGELLVKKAEAGVRVLLLVWSDISDQMGTHDNDTYNYFKGETLDTE